jgi:hypothetical protein
VVTTIRELVPFRPVKDALTALGSFEAVEAPHGSEGPATPTVVLQERAH